MSGILDWAGEVGSAALNIGGDIVGAAGVIPGAGEVVHGLQSIYHSGASIYDSVTGDQQGAERHLTAAGTNALGMIPYVSEAVGGAELGWNGAGLIDHAVNGEARHHSSNEMMTNMIFGHY